MGCNPMAAKRSSKGAKVYFRLPSCYADRMSKYKKKTELVDPKEAKIRHDHMDQAIFNFEGSLDELEGALGMYMIGRHFGWKVLYVIHSKKTIRKYEEVLGIAVRDAFPEVGPDAQRSNGYRAVEFASNFWKTIVSGQIPDKRVVNKAK